MRFAIKKSEAYVKENRAKLSKVTLKESVDTIISNSTLTVPKSLLPPPAIGFGFTDICITFTIKADTSGPARSAMSSSQAAWASLLKENDTSSSTVTLNVPST